MMEPRQYAEWLHSEVFLPVVVVIGTEAAKARVREAHGLSLAELLAPFGGQYRRLSVTYQALDRPMRADSFCVRFADADSASQWSAVHAEQVASWMVEKSAPATLTREPQVALLPPSPWYEQWRSAMFRSLRWSEHEGLDQPCAALLVASSREPDPVALMEQLLHSSHMPPLCTQGVLEPVPARAAVLLHDLADPESPGEAELEGKLESLRRKFQPHPVMVLRIGRGGAGVLPEVRDLYQPHIVARGAPPPPPPPAEPGADAAPAGAAQPGERLSREDLESLAQLAAEVVIRTAVPWMEKELQQLEAQISQSRKGFKNQLKYLWRKPRENPTGHVERERPDGHHLPHDPGAVYPLHTVEGQMRLAGDLAFLLRDYETATNYYRNVVGDFKQDRSWKHAAGAYELWGLCCYITGAPRSEYGRMMETAYDCYLQAHSGRHAARSVALHLAMQGDPKEAANRLLKVNADLQEGGLRNAMAAEQIGQLFAMSGARRKGSFHLVLAGHSFNKLNFKRLALCSYQAVFNQYAHKNWFHITDHFHFTMARQAYGLGLHRESISYFVMLLNSFGIPHRKVTIAPEREVTYIKEFLVVIKTWLDKCPPCEAKRPFDVQVPTIAPDIVVRLPCDGAAPVAPEQPAAPPPPPPPPPPAAPPAAGHPPPDGGEAAMPAPPVAWDRLGEKVLPSLSTEDRLELQWRSSRSIRVFDSLRRVVPVGAQVVVELELTNPMRVKMELASARLGGDLQEEAPPAVPKAFSAKAEVEPSEVSTEVGAPSEYAPTETGSEVGGPSAATFAPAAPAAPGAAAPCPAAEAEAAADAEGAVDFLPQTLEIPPQETRRVRFVAVPKREGLLRLQRVSWELFEQKVYCERPLHVQGRRLRATLEQRASRTKIYGPDRRLELRVRATVPQLEAHLEDFPASASSSSSSPPPANLGASSSPAAAGPLLQGELRSCVLVVRGGSGGGGGVGRPGLRIATSHPAFVAFSPMPDAEVKMDYEGDVFVVPADSDAAWAELRIPVVLRADQVGRHTVRFLLLAEAPPTPGGSNGNARPAWERRQWLTLEETLLVRPCLAVAVRAGPSHREAGVAILSVSLESRAADESLEVVRVTCVASGAAAVGDAAVALEDCAPQGACPLRIAPGHSAQVMFAVRGGAASGSAAEAAHDATAAGARRRLLRASRAAAVAAATSPHPRASGRTTEGGRAAAAAAAAVSGAGASGGAGGSALGSAVAEAIARLPDRVDLVVEWRTAHRHGEAHALLVPCGRLERPSTGLPCPLDIHLLAPQHATMADSPVVTLTLQMRNVSPVGPVSFYFVADPGPDFVWLGPERSEAITLPPMAVKTAELQAYFAAPGVFNLNRFRFFVVAMPSGWSTVPASEQAPVAFAFPLERLVHVRA